MEIAEIDDMAIIVRELADQFYGEYGGENDPEKALPAPTPWERGVESRPNDEENYSLDDF